MAIQLKDGVSDATKTAGLIYDMWKAAMLSMDGWAPSNFGEFVSPNACALYVCIGKKYQWKYYIYRTKMQMWPFYSDQYIWKICINNSSRHNKYYLVSHVAQLGHVYYKIISI